MQLLTSHFRDIQKDCLFSPCDIHKIMIKEMKKLGRPRTDDSEKLKLRQVRIKDREYDLIVRAADAAGVSFSEFMRHAGLTAAGRKKT